MSLRESDVFAPPPVPRPKRRTPAGDRESAVVRQCLQWLHRRGALACRTNSGVLHLANGNWMHTGVPGWPDITGLLPGGRFIGVECKARRGGRQSPDQARMEREIRGRNGIYVLARGVEDVEKGISDATGNEP